MTKSSLPSPEIHEHRSIVWHESSCIPKVRFAVRRLSLGQRIELTRRVRELTGKNEFLRAGSEADQLQAALSDLMMRQLFIEWGLAQIDGLHIDGREATTEVLIAKVQYRGNLASRNKKQKTPNRVPFSVFVASRVELRCMPVKRLGANQELCLVV